MGQKPYHRNASSKAIYCQGLVVAFGMCVYVCLPTAAQSGSRPVTLPLSLLLVRHRAAIEACGACQWAAREADLG